MSEMASIILPRGLDQAFFNECVECQDAATVVLKELSPFCNKLCGLCLYSIPSSELHALAHFDSKTQTDVCIFECIRALRSFKGGGSSASSSSGREQGGWGEACEDFVCFIKTHRSMMACLWAHEEFTRRKGMVCHSCVGGCRFQLKRNKKKRKSS